jgi:hypothetical protein
LHPQLPQCCLVLLQQRCLVLVVVQLVHRRLVLLQQSCLPMLQDCRVLLGQ